MKCADCQEAEAVEAAAKAKANRAAEDEKSALDRSQKSKATEDEYWKKAIDDFLVYAEANGWVLDGWLREDEIAFISFSSGALA